MLPVSTHGELLLMSQKYGIWSLELVVLAAVNNTALAAVAGVS